MITKDTDKELAAPFQEKIISYYFRPSCQSFFQLIATLLIISFVICEVLIITSLIGNIRWLPQYAIFSIPLFCVAGIGYYFLFYKNLKVILDDIGVKRLSLFSSKKINFESIRKLILYNYSYPLIMPPQICPDRLVLTRSFLKIISDDKSFYLSDNMIGFEELLYNIRVLTKKPFENVSQTRWLDIFKF